MTAVYLETTDGFTYYMVTNGLCFGVVEPEMYERWRVVESLYSDMQAEMRAVLRAEGWSVPDRDQDGNRW